jgi:enediyne biosynthesis protein E4
VVVNGHVYPQLDQARLGASAPYRQKKLLYRNLGDGTFEEVAAKLVPFFLDEKVSRGLAQGDFDRDGRLDLVINDLDGSAQLLRNELPGSGRWLLVKLVGGPPGNSDALGAVIAARTGGRAQTRLVRSGTSYISQDEMAQHFGLAAAAKVDALEVRWPDGRKTVVRDVPADKVIVVPR